MHPTLHYMSKITLVHRFDVDPNKLDYNPDQGATFVITDPDPTYSRLKTYKIYIFFFFF